LALTRHTLRKAAWLPTLERPPPLALPLLDPPLLEPPLLEAPLLEAPLELVDPPLLELDELLPSCRW
jgi:hypothetical protein